MSRSPRSTASRSHGSAVSARADLVEHLQRAARRAAVQRTRQRADRADDRGAEVGTGRRDDARRERRRVEAVVDRRDQVLLDRGRVLGRRHVALHHVEVVRRVRRGRRAVRRLEPVAQPPQRGRSASGPTAHVDHRVARAARGVDVDATRGSRASAPNCETRGAQRVERHERVAERARSRAARRRPPPGSHAAARSRP